MVPEPVIKALLELGFNEPTPIQRLSIPAAIRDKLDILGAAETGSGKTLAFGIPLIERILSRRTPENERILSRRTPENERILSSERDKKLQGLIITPTRELAIQIKKHLDDILKYVSGITVGCLVGGLAIPKQERILNKFKPSIIVATPGRLWEIIQSGQQTHLTPDSISALDFLIIDEADRMTEKGHFEEMIHVIEIFKAGEEEEEEEKNCKTFPLKKNKDEVVILDGKAHSADEIDDVFSDFDYTKFEVVQDEDDRKDDKKYKGEKTEEGEKTEQVPKQRKRKMRQILVFSATLTFVHEGPSRLQLGGRKRSGWKRSGSEVGVKRKMSELIQLFGMREECVKVIDLTERGRSGRPDRDVLRESCITCRKEEKDLYLYYFLFEFPGRSIVFCNSVDCLRRLVSVLKLLNLDPVSIHSGHSQKRRLSALEKFTAIPGHGLLVASDVAARGLDMTDVDHVIHFQVPRTVETYVHRSGRTARASKKGVSVLLVEPKEGINYRKLSSALNQGSHFELLPIKEDLLKKLQPRVDLARSVDVLEHSLSKVRVKSDWFRKAAQDMDIDIEDRDDLFEERHGTEEVDKKKKRLKMLKSQLVSSLKQPISVRRDRLVRTSLLDATSRAAAGKTLSFSSHDCPYDESSCHPCTLRIDSSRPMRRQR